MLSIARTDTSLFGRWWWTVDRWTLAALISIIAVGAVLTLAASPPVADRLGLDPFYFVRRQFVFLPLALAVVAATSLMSPRGIRRLAVVCFAVAVVLMVLTPVLGEEIKGASRWIVLFGQSVQPSEFVKPSFAVITAWLCAARRLEPRFPGYAISTALFAVVAALLLMQPDVGMTMVVAAVWGAQFFLAGLPLLLVGLIGVVFISGAVGTYFAFQHVQGRVDRFFSSSAGDSFQVTQSLEAFRNGGLMGRGPGEGQIKAVLPDAHADFIFAVAGEELGLIACLVIVALFAFVVMRGFSRLLKEDSLFVLLAVTGLLVQFGLQTLINMASATNLIPPKGMTLPFVSYGGSSVLALALTMGMVLALTRERPGRGIAEVPR
ncbi:MAG: putative peptidoglycan glycosyltransferase FtsW [Rhodospirillales bacterium]|jgi:cell division protein FtsW|nr:putative peptidoglycan glycosyltransferase FtsW [Rhodospirillales bacterium]MDP7650762.1 putative peptidoglycan glycosyltransferase FtsW [Rhodospirillales bacterium]